MSSSAVAQYEVTIVYNGVPRQVMVNPNQAVQAVLQHALNEFGIRQNRDNFRLSLESGQPLDNHTSVKDAGVVPGSRLLLGPRQVSGGQ